MATTAAIGGMMIPEMKKKGYDPAYAATLVCFGGIVGPIIPPSLSFVLYGATTKTSVPDLFKAGIIPGVLIGLVFLVVNIIICKRTGTDLRAVETEKIPLKVFWGRRLKRLWIATKDGFWALLSPVIILGGIYSGFFTPTEAAAVSVVYSVIVSMFVYRDMSWKDLYETFVASAVLNGVTSFLLGYSTVFSTFMTFEQVPQMITNFLTSVSDNPAVVLLIINLILLVIGCFLDTVPAIIIMAPMLLPAVQSLGVNPIHFGVVMAVNLAVGLCTPPYGCNLFVGSAVAKIKMESMFKWIVPFLIVAIALIMLLTYVPALSLALLERIYVYGKKQAEAFSFGRTPPPVCQAWGWISATGAAVVPVRAARRRRTRPMGNSRARAATPALEVSNSWVDRPISRAPKKEAPLPKISKKPKYSAAFSLGMIWA